MAECVPSVGGALGSIPAQDRVNQQEEEDRYWEERGKSKEADGHGGRAWPEEGKS